MRFEGGFEKIIGQMSKGYRQRVGVADAILHRPEVIMLDEPTIGLDPHQVRLFRHMIASLASKPHSAPFTHISFRGRDPL